MKPDTWRRVGFATLVLGVGAVGAYLYLRYVWYAGPTLAWPWGGRHYELLSPRMLGLALLAPYFLWMIGRSLADLPVAQRVISVVLRVAFLILLSFGLARVARSATTQKVCTVYLVDVSESVPDAALEDARAEIQKGLDERPEDGLVRLITFARRPRVVQLADDAKQAPLLERHEPLVSSPQAGPLAAHEEGKPRLGLGAATDIASALQLACPRPTRFGRST